MAGYSVARIGYALAYVLIEKEELSLVRTAFWYAGNICCVSMMVLAGKRL